MYKGKITNRTRLQKLGRVISYLKETIHLPLVIGADNSGNLTWNIDTSSAIRPDYKSHTGACLTLGHGSVLCISVKQKINTKSSAESELLVLMMPQLS